MPGIKKSPRRAILFLSLCALDDAFRQAGDALDLAGDDDLRGAAVGGGGEGLHGLDLQDGVRGGGLIDAADTFGRGRLDLQDGFGFTFGLENLLLLLRVGAENGGFLFALGLEDGSLLLAFGAEDGFAAFAFGLHLLLHGVADGFGRQDVLQLNAVDLDAPGVRRLVEDGAHLRVDDVAAGEAFVKLELADDVSQSRRGEVLDGYHGLLDAVGEELRVSHLEVDDGVYLHGDVVLRDDGLRREVSHLLLEGDGLGDLVDEGDLDVQTGVPGSAVGTEALDDAGLRLLDDADVGDDENEDDDSENDEGKHGEHREPPWF